MNIKDMHYDFKKKLNKVDSQQYKNLLIPEIDWVLNEAQLIFISVIAESRHPQIHGFEKTQKNIDDIRSIVVNGEELTEPMTLGEETVDYPLPEDYMHYIRASCEIENDTCPAVESSISIERHGDEFLKSPFNRPSYDWRVVNGLFTENGLKLYSDGTFVINKMFLSYIRKPEYMHNAEDFRSGSYELPSGVTLTGFQDCELPWQTHGEIVDLAVLITTGEINPANFQMAAAKVGMNFLK